MPVILAPGDYARWLGDEPDPRELMRPFRADLMRMWPISMRVNKPENVDPAGTDIGLNCATLQNCPAWPVSSHCRPLRVLCCFESTGMKIPRTETGIRRNPFVL
jgi:hypothetical protein